MSDQPHIPPPQYQSSQLPREVMLGREYSSNLHHLISDDDVFIPTTLLSKDYVVYYHPTMEQLAKNLRSSLLNRHNNIACSLGQITWKSFNDGFPDLFIHNIQDLVGRDIIFVGAFNTPGDIFEQLSVCAMFPMYRPRSLSVILPYSPVATMERSSCPGEVITAVSLAKMFGIISCKTDLYLVDLHTYHNLHYFPDHIFPVFVHSAHKLKQILLNKKFEEQQNVSIVFPDSGAMQRYRYVIPPFEYVVCTKIRDGDKRLITITQGQDMINDRDLYLIDDLIHSGGTIRETINALNENYKPKSISLFITHGIFENESYKPFIEMYEKGIIKDFFLCDTNPMAIKLDGVGPFKTISIAGDLADVLVHNRQVQYDELQQPNEKNGNSTNNNNNGTHNNNCPSILPTSLNNNSSGGSQNGSIQSVQSPIENQYHCKECTLLLHRHARALQSQQMFLAQHSYQGSKGHNNHHSNHSSVFKPPVAQVPMTRSGHAMKSSASTNDVHSLGEEKEDKYIAGNPTNCP